MKKLSLLAAFLWVPLAGFAQNSFAQFEDMDNVATVIINKSMINLLTSIGNASDDPEAREFMDLAKGLEGLKVFVTEDKSVSDKMKTSVDAYLKSSSLEELMRVKDDETNVKFYVKNGKDEDHVVELLMFVTGIDKVKVGHNGRNVESVLLTLTGDIDLRKIGTLTQHLDLPNDLNKAEKKQ